VTAPDLIGLFIEPLEGTAIPYMITGGVASVIYGDPRFTRDVDVVLELRLTDVPRLARAFPENDYCVPPSETLAEEASGRASTSQHPLLWTSRRRSVACLRGRATKPGA